MSAPLPGVVACLCALACGSVAAGEKSAAVLESRSSIRQPSPKPLPEPALIARSGIEMTERCAQPVPADTVSATTDKTPSDASSTKEKIQSTGSEVTDKDAKGAPAQPSVVKADKDRTATSASPVNDGNTTQQTELRANSATQELVIFIGWASIVSSGVLLILALAAAFTRHGRFAFRRDWGGFGGGGGEGWHLSTPLVMLASALVLASFAGFLGLELTSRGDAGGKGAAETTKSAQPTAK